MEDSKDGLAKQVFKAVSPTGEKTLEGAY